MRDELKRTITAAATAALGLYGCNRAETAPAVEALPEEAPAEQESAERSVAPPPPQPESAAPERTPAPSQPSGVAAPLPDPANREQALPLKAPPTRAPRRPAPGTDTQDLASCGAACGANCGGEGDPQ